MQPEEGRARATYRILSLDGGGIRGSVTAFDLDSESPDPTRRSWRPKLFHWGYAQWAQPLVSLMRNGVAGIADYQCRQIFGDRYHRLAPVFPPGVSMPEDRCRVRKQAGSKVMATLRNLVIGLFRLAGAGNIAAALRACAWERRLALRIIGLASA